MRIPIYQLDAFAASLYAGNPAAVMVLDQFLPDDTLRSIAAENNLSETAFLVKNGTGYRLRWFTPTCEVPLCGHATLASAAVVLERLEPELNEIAFATASGILTVRRVGEAYCMNFPSQAVQKVNIPAGCNEALGASAVEVWKNERFTLVLLQNAEMVRRLNPKIEALAALDPHGVIVTAAGDEGYDMVSRFFAPLMGIAEDPVTGSAHCVLAPYWAERLGKKELRAYQASARGGEMICRVFDGRVELEGKCVFYLEGVVEV